MTPTNARKTKSAAIPTSMPMRNSNTPYEDQMNNKKIMGKQFYPCSAVDKGAPETPQNLEVQKRGSRKRNRHSNSIGTRGFEKVTTAVPFQNEKKQPKRKRVKQSKRKRVKSSNQQDETQREVAEESNKRRWRRPKKRRRSRARRKVETFGGASSSVVGTICPLPVEIAFPNDLPKIGGVSGTSGSAIPARRRPNKRRWRRPNERIDANKIFPTNQVNLDLFSGNGKY